MEILKSRQVVSLKIAHASEHPMFSEQMGIVKRKYASAWSEGHGSVHLKVLSLSENSPALRHVDGVTANGLLSDFIQSHDTA